MTKQQGTQDIFKFVMSAPPAEPLTLSPPMLMLLREWLRNDALEIKHLHAELAGSRNDYTALCDEKDDLHKRHIKLGDNYHNDSSKLNASVFEIEFLKAELDATRPSWDDAPEWATHREIVCIWRRYEPISYEFRDVRFTDERRPEVE